MRLGVFGPLILTLFLAASGCETTQPGANEPEPTFPAKSIDDKSVTFDKFDRQRAIRAYWKIRAHALFEVVIDRNGGVVQVRTIRTQMDDFMTAGFKANMYGTKFSPANSSDPHPYRALYCPIRTHTEVGAAPSDNTPYGQPYR